MFMCIINGWVEASAQTWSEKTDDVTWKISCNDVKRTDVLANKVMQKTVSLFFLTVEHIYCRVQRPLLDTWTKRLQNCTSVCISVTLVSHLHSVVQPCAFSPVWDEFVGFVHRCMSSSTSLTEPLNLNRCQTRSDVKSLNYFCTTVFIFWVGCVKTMWMCLI